MNKKILIISIGITMLSFLNSCYYDKADVLTDGFICDSTSYTYSGQIQPIISQYCISCHNATTPNGTVRLDNYDQVKINADNGNLLGAIRHEAGFSNMPKDQPQLNPCNITLIEKWVADGSPNN
jgi:hypothetical protein